MRLIDVKEGLIHLEYELDNILVSKENLKDLDLGGFSRGLNIKLSEINYNNIFENEISSLSSYFIYNANSSFSDHFKNGFIELLRQIAKKIVGLRRLLEEAVVDYNNFENIYSIKLPKYEYFEDVAEFTKKINFIFSSVLNGNKKAKLVGFDVGSEWYLIALESLLDFKLFAVFMEEVFKYIKYKAQDEERLKNVELENEVKQIFIDNMKVMQEATMGIAVKRVFNASEQHRDVEDMVKIQKSIIEMGKLVIQGTRVQVDKQTPTDENENVPKVEIPSLESIMGYLESSVVQLLEDNENEEGTS